MRHWAVLLGLLWAVGASPGAATKSSENDDNTSPTRRPLPEMAQRASDDGYLAPRDIQAFGRDKQLAVLGSVGQRLMILDGATGEKRRSIRLPAAGSGMVVRGATAYVTTCEPAGRVLVVDLDAGVLRKQIRVGHTPLAPVLSPDGRMLCVANRFDHTVALLDLAAGTSRTVAVVREPVALALSADGKRLFVANHLPRVRPFLDDENPSIAAEVSVIDTPQARLLQNIELPNGSQGLRGIALSPDGRYVAVTHILSNYTIPTLSIEKGAINRNALSLLSTDTLEWFATVILDDPDRGAANPWAVDFSSDASRLLVTHAGTHELSVIDYAALLARAASSSRASSLHGEEALHTMAGIRRRIRLPINGARGLLERGGVAYASGFFSDNLAAVDLKGSEPSVRRIELEEAANSPTERLGEQYFNDASLCFQQWQSCATCHPDGRSDALYWDLLHDGAGNTKNTKSLLMSALTPPVMWRGTRADAGVAVREGIRHIQFVEPHPGQAQAIEDYLLQMKAVPSPHLNAAVLETPKTEDASCAKCHYPGVPRGTLTDAARRGKAIFEGKAGCATCHPHPSFTSLRTVDPGLGSGVPYHVPSLVEAWRTAPYLHNGDALTLKETITNFNFLQKRGHTRELTAQELDDLLEYLQSL